MLPLTTLLAALLLGEAPAQDEPEEARLAHKPLLTIAQVGDGMTFSLGKAEAFAEIGRSQAASASQVKSSRSNA